jgi:hypothetical protein
MSEEHLEAIAERFFDRLDARFLKTDMSQTVYDTAVIVFTRWEAECRQSYRAPATLVEASYALANV